VYLVLSLGFVSFPFFPFLRQNIKLGVLGVVQQQQKPKQISYARYNQSTFPVLSWIIVLSSPCKIYNPGLFFYAPFNGQSMKALLGSYCYLLRVRAH
jgi:hypothetical protein